MEKPIQTYRVSPAQKGPKYPPLGPLLRASLFAAFREALIASLFLVWIYMPIYHSILTWYRDGRSRIFEGSDNQMFYTLASVVVKSGCYVIYHGLFYMIERSRILEIYKLNRKSNILPSRDSITDTLFDAAITNLLAIPLASYFLLFPLSIYAGMPPLEAPLSGDTFLLGLWENFKFFAICSFLNEFLLYWAHRLFHHKMLYSRFHKQHHSYIGTVSFASEYSHPVENLVVNIIPSLSGPILLACHFAQGQTWIIIRLFTSYAAHCGYCFKGSWFDWVGYPTPEYVALHDFHHTNNQGCYGAPIFDWIFGSMDAWVESGGMEAYLRKRDGENASYLHRKSL